MHSKALGIQHQPVYISRNVKEEVLQPGANIDLHKMMKNTGSDNYKVVRNAVF